MKSVFQHAALPGIVALAIVPISALAEDKPSLTAIYEITLDIDHDGKMDRAVLVSAEGAGYYTADKGSFRQSDSVDLYIYLSGGDERLDLSRKPTFLKKDIGASERNSDIFPLESGANGSLIVKAAFGMYSIWAPETLTIAYRNGEFLVAGVTYDWETRNSMGGCDINFLTGKGLVSQGLAKSKPLKAKFKPVKLADWSEEKRPKACNF